jgi:hypothetical protein
LSIFLGSIYCSCSSFCCVFLKKRSVSKTTACPVGSHPVAGIFVYINICLMDVEDLTLYAYINIPVFHSFASEVHSVLWHLMLVQSE